MKNYSANLYRKFKTRTLNTLNGDDFFEYFMKVVESGVRYYGQKNETLIKIIDEEWVKAIENCLIPIENIIKQPRKFIQREENIVPIELARKVGSDAVKHLATHTHFISRVEENGDVIPNKILNVYNEESYEIYENRFVITLLNRINSFLDKRYEALFETTGDEFASILKIDSSFNDNDEKVEYNLVLKLHQGQGYLDSKNNDPMIYHRIEHIRIMLNGFKKSEFYQILSGTTPVRSPVSRTNLILKEPNFKMCYELWQFMDRYTEVGYAIEKKEYEGEFDEQYLDELNTLVLFNYLVMKNNLAGEHNKPVDVINFKKKRVLKPKFIHQIIEDFVYDYDIPEVELRKIFNEEISKAYSGKTENEDDIKSAIERALSIEFDKKDRELQREKEKAELARAAEEEKERQMKEKLREKEKAAQKRAEAEEKARLAKLREKEKAERAKVVAKEKARLAKEKEQLAKTKMREKEKADHARAIAEEKERLTKIKLRDKEKVDRARAITKEKERLAKIKLREKEKADRVRAIAEEKERLAKIKLREKEKADRVRAIAEEKERLAKIKLREKEKAKKINKEMNT